MSDKILGQLHEYNKQPLFENVGKLLKKLGATT